MSTRFGANSEMCSEFKVMEGKKLMQVNVFITSRRVTESRDYPRERILAMSIWSVVPPCMESGFKIPKPWCYRSVVLGSRDISEP